MHVKFLILGAGPTGLGAAWRLAELGQNDFLVLERDNHVGGLSASFTDRAGFTWDVGGHVVFSHYDYFDRLLADLLGNDVLRHQRESWVRAAATWVPYPFQNNIRRLPPELAWECVEGLLAASAASARGEEAEPAHFRDWIDRVFGPGIARLFMVPYNFKVWAHPAETMSHAWIGERVCVVDAARVIKNIVLGRDDVAWGPNNTFAFPLYGGTGEIYRRLAGRFADRVALNQAAVRVDPATRTARTATGVVIAYEHLLTTMPLDRFVTDVLAQANETLLAAAASLKHNGAVIHGLGFAGAPADPRCWMYFPEADCPFYRVTNFHNYSPFNTPDPDGMRLRSRAIMTETSFSGHKPEDAASLAERTLAGLVNTTLIEASDRDRLTSVWEQRVDYAYPIPCLERDAALAVIQPALEALDIFSRGRFGGWKYEAGNMDHSLMQGVQWAERVVCGQNETVYALPEPRPLRLTSGLRSETQSGQGRTYLPHTTPQERPDIVTPGSDRDVFAARRERLRERLRETGHESLLVFHAANRYYLSGFELHDPQCNESAGLLCVSVSGRDALFTDARYKDAALRLWPEEDLCIYGAGRFAAIAAFLKSRGIGHAAFEAAAISFETHARLAEHLPLTPVTWAVEPLRLIKDADEIARMRRSAAVNHAVMERLPQVLLPGRTEAQAAWEIEKLFREFGATELAFSPIVAVGPNAALPHAIPGDTMITDNCPVLVDVGGRRDDYCSDQTRTVWVGNNPPEHFQKTLDQVQRAQAAALAGLRPGLSFREAHNLARDVFEREGVAAYFTHSLGHGIGLETHEGPSLNPAAEGVLAEGMVVTVEPGLYYPDWGGARWEHMALITADGCETL